ncbi:MAG TPA: DUF2500 domain-containing protein [Terrabacter sp.]|nr:DUF2500 domain-containing protein [Terrabacter sp.]
MVTDELGPLTPDMSGPPTLFLLFFGVVATLVVCGFVFTGVKLFSQWRADESSPLRSIDAMVVSRRTDVRRSTRSVGAPMVGSPDASTGAPMTTGTMATSSSTSCFVTFEESSGERRELRVSGGEFGQLAEGDRGHLIHQGSRYKGFTRLGAADGTR